MLQLKGITKIYAAGSGEVRALRGVDISFRKSEFVSILGPSGCGKTTMLNIVGGLDQYTDGDLVINGVSTKNYKDTDWDAYRNHSVGFVFQSYNLIPHQSVIANVELALTLSGVSKTERLERAKTVLEKVGLGDQLYKKPNQLSGGQMQRVAIARALINDPDILLADEPTGALDTETSGQVMELLREISQGRLVIMVTHNSELAERYSTRIIRLLDGNVTGDTNPPTESELVTTPPEKKKYPSMSFTTAIALSFKNLLTKKARTILTSFAGSIGIIGIALILSLSNGLQSFIDDTERDTLSSYPISIESATFDLTSLMQSFMGTRLTESDRPLDRVYANTFMWKMMNTMMSEVKQNDLAAFRKHIIAHEAELSEYTTAITYTYDVPLNLYHTMENGVIEQVSPNSMINSFRGGMSGGSSMSSMSSFMGTNSDLWRPMIPEQDFLETQYEVVAGDFPRAYDEAVLVVTAQHEIPDMLLYSLGIKGQAELDELMNALMKGETVDDEADSYEYNEIIGLEYNLIIPSSLYEESGSGWIDRTEDTDYLAAVAQTAPTIKIVGILRPHPNAAASTGDVFIGYTDALTQYVVEQSGSAEIVKQQLENPETDVFTGLPFEATGEPLFSDVDSIIAYINTIEDEAERQQMAAGIEQMQAYGMTEEQIIQTANEMVVQEKTDATYDGNIAKLGYARLDNPSMINIYASSFENKDLVADFIAAYNETVEEGGEIVYTDYVGLLMSSMTTIINAISYVLIAFVSISLVVSSIMIGIITYISVLERTREIGVLRSIGASKGDIARVFNAETLIIGLAAGALGIVVTWLLTLPANAIIGYLTVIPRAAVLPLTGAVALIIISMLLTFIAGLIPSRLAAKKDPVVALRTE